MSEGFRPLSRPNMTCRHPRQHLKHAWMDPSFQIILYRGTHPGNQPPSPRVWLMWHDAGLKSSCPVTKYYWSSPYLRVHKFPSIRPMQAFYLPWHWPLIWGLHKTNAEICSVIEKRLGLSQQWCSVARNSIIGGRLMPTNVRLNNTNNTPNTSKCHVTKILYVKPIKDCFFSHNLFSAKKAFTEGSLHLPCAKGKT